MSEIDLSKLPAPEVIKYVDYDTVLDEMLTSFTTEMQKTNANYSRPTQADPVYQAFSVTAYRTIKTQQEINDSAKSIMLAYATGGDLDNLGALFKVKRLVVTPAENGKPAVMETDKAFRRRVLLAPESWTNAGSIGAYKYFALSADSNIQDVWVSSPSAARVTIEVLSKDGVPTQALLDKVKAAVNGDSVRPIGDLVTIMKAGIDTYDVDLELTLADGFSDKIITDLVTKRLEAFAADNYKLRNDIEIGQFYAAVQVEGVEKITLKLKKNGSTSALPITVGTNAPKLGTLKVSVK